MMKLEKPHFGPISGSFLVPKSQIETFRKNVIYVNFKLLYYDFMENIRKDLRVNFSIKLRKTSFWAYLVKFGPKPSILK